MKHCPSCGAPLPDNAGFCGKCGNMMMPTDPVIKLAPGDPNAGSSMRFKIIIGAILAVVLITGGFLGWNHFSSQGGIDQKLDLAVKYLSDNNYEKAILAYNQAIEIDPKEVKAYQGLARVYTLQGKYDDAKDTYDKGLKAVTTEDQIVLRLGLGGMYIDQGQMDKAEKTFREIKDGNSPCLEAYWGLAMVYKQKGDTANAEAMLKQAAEQNSNEYRAYNALALYQQQNGQSDEAFDNLVKSLSLEINQQEAYLVLRDLFKDNWSELRARASGLPDRQVGVMLEFYNYYAVKDYQNAVDTYEAILKDQTDNDKAQILAAIAMYKTGNTGGAENLIKQISSKDINQWLLSDIAEYYYVTGDKEKAKATAIKALEANSINLDAVALLQRINANDQDGKIYTAEYLLYNWRPVSVVKDTLADFDIKLFIGSDIDNATEEDVDSDLLTSEYLIPDISKTYVYIYKDGAHPGSGLWNGQKTINWTRNQDGSYTSTQRLYFDTHDGKLWDMREQRSDNYTLDGGSMLRISGSTLFNADGGTVDEKLVSGKEETIKQVKPGDKWTNTYTYSISSDRWDSSSEETHTQTVCFIGFSDISCLGTTRQAAHIQITKDNYQQDYWLVKGIGIVKYETPSGSYRYSEELSAIE